ncbi:MAG: bifunctional nuclease family protein [Bacteroidales bacterium]
MEKKKMIVEKVEESLMGNLYDIFLKEEEGDRLLIISIGGLEAKRIIALMDDMVMPRPLTHDLFFNVLDDFGIGIDEVIITNFYEGIYAASILCVCEGVKKFFDARSSDAINMALKFKSPIFASEEILRKVGISSSEMDNREMPYNDIKIIIESSDDKKLSGLETLLSIAVEQEDYDSAAELRDEIDKLKNND